MRFKIAAAISAALLAMAAMAAPPGQLRKSVTLAWDYPANELTTNLTFKIYGSPDLSIPMTNWPVVALVAGTNTTVTFPIEAKQMFYSATASNWFGESVFSNVAATERPPRGDSKLSIGP